MSRSVTPTPPTTRLKTTLLATKKPQKDPTDHENNNSDGQAKEQAINFLTAKEYLTPGNPITLHILAHVLSQLGSAASKMPKALTDGIKAVVILMNDYASQQIVNEIVTSVATHLKEHLDAFSSNVENMRDAVEHVTTISKMWESWFGLAKPTMFGSDGRAKYDHVMVITPYQSISICCGA